MNNIWTDTMKEISFAPGYFCTHDGAVYSFKESTQGKKMKPNVHKRDGVPNVSLRINGESKVFKLSYIIAKTHIPNPQNFLHVKNKNGNKLDCSIENLEWFNNPQVDINGRFVKGRKAENEIWSPEYLKNKLKTFIINFYGKHGIILPSTQIKSFDSKLFSALRHRVEKPNQYYLSVLDELNLPTPSNSYYKDGYIFRGFYELVGYCILKSWGMKFQPFKELDFDGKLYISDGFFPDHEIYWEHWGGLNPNNKLKKEFYSKLKIFLIETIDDECQKPKNGIKYLYNQLRESLLSYYPSLPSYNVDTILGLLSAEIPNHKKIMEFIVETLKILNQTNNIDERVLRTTDEGYKVISLINKYFNGRITLLKLELNKLGFNYSIKADRGSYRDLDYFISQISPYIREYKRVPTQSEFSKLNRNDVPIMASRLIGGIEQLRRNQLEEGNFFYITKSILGEKAPFDKKLEWGNETNETIGKILKYYKSKNIEIPKTLNDLRNKDIYKPFGKQLHTQINRPKIGGWEKFQLNFYE